MMNGIKCTGVTLCRPIAPRKSPYYVLDLTPGFFSSFI